MEPTTHHYKDVNDGPATGARAIGEVDAIPGYNYTRPYGPRRGNYVNLGQQISLLQ
jgi:hypothetical protein